MTWTIQESTAYIERYIVTGMIVSDDCLRTLAFLSPHKYLETDFSKTVAKWCISYYERYQRAPGPDIRIIFEAARRDGLNPDQARQIGQFLTSLSQEFEHSQQFNSQYAIDEAKKYFQERSLWKTYGELGKLLEKGNILQAQAVLMGYEQINIEAATLGCEPFTDRELIKRAFSKTDELFTLPGALGYYIGPLERDWLWGIVAPYKRGKTWTMQFIALQAYYNMLNVAWFNHEMGNYKMVRRLAQGLAAMPAKPSRKQRLMPIWDCVLNQTGNCSRPERTGFGVLREESSLVTFESNPSWFPCTACYGQPGSDYQTDTWVKPFEIDLLDWRIAYQKAEATVNHFMATRFKLQTFPKYSAGFEEICQTLHIWEHMEGFRADVIIVDQPSAWKKEGDEEGRHIVDRQWKQLSGLAQEKHALVVAASQAGGKDTLNLRSLGQGNVGEDSRLLGHVDCMMAKNQTDLEKKLHRCRMAATAARDDDFNITDEIVVLQQLALGQPYLDSRFVNSTIEEQYKNS